MSCSAATSATRRRRCRLKPRPGQRHRSASVAGRFRPGSGCSATAHTSPTATTWRRSTPASPARGRPRPRAVIAGLDTSTVVPLLADEPQDLTLAALAYLTEQKGAGDRVPAFDWVLVEIYCALQHHHGASKNDTLKALRRFPRRPGHRKDRRGHQGASDPQPRVCEAGVHRPNDPSGLPQLRGGRGRHLRARGILAVQSPVSRRPRRPSDTLISELATTSCAPRARTQGSLRPPKSASYLSLFLGGGGGGGGGLTSIGRPRSPLLKLPITLSICVTGASGRLGGGCGAFRVMSGFSFHLKSQSSILLVIHELDHFDVDRWN
jgi:hypothetical protein